MDLHAYAHELVQDITAQSEANSVSTHDAFAERVLGELETAGHIEDWNVAYYRTYGAEVSGYGFNETLNTLDLFLVQFRQQPLEVKVAKSDLTARVKRVSNYLGRAADGLSGQLDDIAEAHDMASTVSDAVSKVVGLRVFIVTNEISTVRALEAVESSSGLPVTVELWDLRRLHRLTTSGVLHDPIVVDLAEPLPCLSTPVTDQNYSVFLAIIRADVLGGIYSKFGPRLLELNVRSFLQLKGAVNRGIRETLIHAPERFLAYNNGISATASKIEMRRLGDGSPGISRIHDLQIVNGGQTTASIHSSFLRDEADLSQVFVQMKLTVVQPEALDKIAPEISRSSNTQNKVTVVDFSSNDRFHVDLEKVSRTLWAPAAQGSGEETKWFFERARGQYADAVSRERTSAKQAAFKLQFPTRQKFLKTDVAKWENSWSQKPWIVCRGAEKNFRAFMDEQRGKVPTSDVSYVRRLIAKGVLFRAAERVVTQQQFGGYRANIVAYTIAKLCNRTSQRLDLDRIWRDQDISDATSEAIAEVSVQVYKIINEPVGGSHVGEWTKKEACWARVSAFDWEASALLRRELIDVRKAAQDARSESVAGMTEEEAAEIAQASAISSESWFALSHWARETGSLEPWQRGLAFSLGRVASRGGEPSPRQAKQGLIVLEAATALGFRG